MTLWSDFHWLPALLAFLICGSLPASAQQNAAIPDKPNSHAGDCSTADVVSTVNSAAPGWNGWGVSLDNSRFQPAAAAGLNAHDLSKLRLRWAFGFEGATMAFSQPAVANGLLFVGSQSGAVYALDSATGCTVWTFKAQAPVRTGFVIGQGLGLHGHGNALYFGDQHGAAYALDAASGRLLWKEQADPHPAAMITGTPQLWRDRLYVPVASYEEEENLARDPHYQCCTFRGSVVAFNARTGRQTWKTYTISDPPRNTGMSKAGTQLWGPSGAGVWSAPTLDPQRRILYVATGNNYSAPATGTSDAVIALSMDSGKILWTQQIAPNDVYNLSCEDFADPAHSNCPATKGPDSDFGASPILVTTREGHQIIVASQKSGVVYGLDPAQQGKVIWQTRVGKGGLLGGIEWGSATDGENVYAALSDCAWKTFDRVHNGKNESVVDVDPEKGGGLFALRLTDGHKVWEAPPATTCANREHCSPAQLAAVTAIPGVVFSGSLDGHLRAYSSQSGEVLWDYDTVRYFPTVNGVSAHGGSLNGPGSVVVGGMLYVNSGYIRFRGAPGNVLLAFSIDGK